MTKEIQTFSFDLSWNTKDFRMARRTLSLLVYLALSSLFTWIKLLANENIDIVKNGPDGVELATLWL